MEMDDSGNFLCVRLIFRCSYQLWKRQAWSTVQTPQRMWNFWSTTISQERYVFSVPGFVVQGTLYLAWKILNLTIIWYSRTLTTFTKIVWYKHQDINGTEPDDWPNKLEKIQVIQEWITKHAKCTPSLVWYRTSLTKTQLWIFFFVSESVPLRLPLHGTQRTSLLQTFQLSVATTQYCRQDFELSITFVRVPSKCKLLEHRCHFHMPLRLQLWLKLIIIA